MSRTIVIGGHLPGPVKFLYETKVAKRIFQTAIIFAVALFSTVAQAQHTEPTPQKSDSSTASHQEKTQEITLAQIAADREKLSEQLQTARQHVEDSAPDSGVGDAARRTLEALRAADLIYEQQIAALKRRDEFDNATPFAQELAREADEHKDKQGNVDFRFIEQLKDKLVSARELTASANEFITHANERLEGAKRAYKSSEQSRRQSKEQFTADNPVLSSDAQAKLSQLEAESRLAGLTVQLRELELANERISRQKQQERTTLLNTQLRQLAPKVRFTRASLDDQITEIDTKIFDLSRLIESAKLDGTDIERRLSDARVRQEQLGSDSESSLAEQVRSLQMARETNQLIQVVSTSRVQRLRSMATIWEKRFALANALAHADDYPSWRKETKELLEQWRKDSRLHEAQLVDTRRESSAVMSRIDNTAQTSGNIDLIKWLQDERKQLETRARVYEADIAHISTAEQLAQKFLDELGQYLRTPHFQEIIGSLATALSSFWSYEFASVDDSPITVSKIIIALVLLILSFTTSRRLSRFVGRKVVPRFSLNGGAAAAIQSLLFYVLISCFALLALHIVHIPLTIFTFLGGALAIGLGFGGQHLINHFISGLVILIEQPVRVGDIVELDGLQGEVKRIGARSTIVRTNSNVDIIVPNSTFLEKNVINWTLVDNKVRIFVRVGVMYGSPTRKVASLMRKAAEEHGRVLKDPAPFLLFKDFGDSALVFEIYFWVRIKSVTEAQVIESDIRYRIDNLFRAANIVIAYPQRDVHLTSDRPLEVKMVPQARLHSRDIDQTMETKFLPDDIVPR